jgi:hypothetical protein
VGPSPWGLDARTRRERAQAIATALRDFVRENPGWPLRALLLPVDFATSPERAHEVLDPETLSHFDPPPWEDTSPWTELLPMIADVPLIDLRARLARPGDFQAADYHLSAAGHLLFADAVRSAILAAQGAP